MSVVSGNIDEDVVREGLLCPICMQDLGTVLQLEHHFETAHSSEDTAILNSLKGLFGKAKRKILRRDSESDLDGSFRGPDDDSTTETNYVRSLVNWEQQELGKTSSHTEVFKQIRSSRIDNYVVETNKLLIRLDKLITDVPADPHKRKAREQSVVRWINDKDVKLCPSCARSFSVARRRHHCRLCGCVMCMACSEYVDFSYAKKLTNPVFANVAVSSSESTSSVSVPSSLSALGLFQLRRTGSNSSLASMINYSSGEKHIRTCRDCKKLLKRRDQQIEQRTNRPNIVLFYEKLKVAIDEAKRLTPVYNKLADSMNAGETNYHLKDAVDLKMKLKKLAETIDLYSKKILVLGKDNDPPPHPKMLQLQKGVRLGSTIFLQENLVTLPKLPTEELLKELQNTRREVIQQKVQHERQQAIKAQKQAEQIKNVRGRDDIKIEFSPSKALLSEKQKSNRILSDECRVDTDDGWVSQVHGAGTSNQDADPMVQQMNNIRMFIKQARDAHKYDEVELLEANLKLLQQEYLKQQSKRANTSRES